jgi:hypothetical protein
MNSWSRYLETPIATAAMQLSTEQTNALRKRLTRLQQRRNLTS